MSRRPHKPTSETRAQVSALKSYGHTHEEIAAFLGIDDETMVKYYDRELSVACLVANAEVARKLYNKAVYQDDLGAQIFWLKTRGRWRTQDVEALLEQNETLKAELKLLREQLYLKHMKDH